MSKHANRFDSTYRPLARTEELVTTEAKDELLVYDQRTHHIHHLNSSARLIYRLANGKRNIPDLAREAADLTSSTATEEDIVQALRSLSDANLLEVPLPTEASSPRWSRRKLLRRSVSAGLLVPAAIVSVSAPAAAISTSCTFQVGQNGCVHHSDCCPFRTEDGRSLETFCSGYGVMVGDCWLA